MANEIHELVVKLSPEGADATQESLNQTSESFEDAADTAEQQTGKLEAFSERWKGAFGVIAAGLAVGVGALASQVPVLGELFSGLTAIVQSLALAMDTVLRPVLTPITNLMFSLANAIDQAPAPIRTLIGLLTTLASGFILVTGAVITLTSLSLVQWLSLVAAKAMTAAGAISAFASSILGIAAIIAIVVAAIGLLGTELLGLTDVTPIATAELDSFAAVLGEIAFLTGGLLIGFLIALAQLLTGDVSGAFETAKKFAAEWMKASARFAARVQAGFLALGQSLRTIFETTWRVIMHFTRKALNTILHLAEDVINRIISNLNILPGFDFEKVEFETFSTTSIEQIAREQRRRGRRRLRAVRDRARRQIQAFAPGGQEQQDRPSNRFAEDMNININVDDSQFGKAVNASVDKGVSDRGR